MPIFLRPSLFVLLILLSPVLAAPPRAHADPLSEMQAFSEFKDIDLAKLADSKPLTARGGPIKGFPRGLAVQTCYIVRLPLQKAVELHQKWSPSRHPELKIYLQGNISSKPSIADFKDLANAPDNSSVKWLAEATEHLDPAKLELQMSAAEAKEFSKGSGSKSNQKGPFPPAVSAFWSNLLYQRALAYASGGMARQPAYDVGGESIRSSEELTRLLAEQPKIRNQFKTMLNEAALMNSGGKLAPSLYYQLFDAKGHAAFTLGASYAKVSGESAQLIDTQFYSSGGYFTLLTLLQLWPVKIGAEEATLIWRADLLSSASLAGLHGVERLGSSGVMKKEIEKSILLLQKDAKDAAALR